MSATPAGGEPPANETPDLALLRRTFVLANQAKQAGNIRSAPWSLMPRAT